MNQIAEDDEVVVSNDDDALNFLSPRALRAYFLEDGKTPWWAIALLDLKQGTAEYRVRMMREWGGRAGSHNREFWEAWANCVEWAEQRVMQKSMREWIDLGYNQTDHSTDEPGPMTAVIRDACLRSPRTFVEFTELRDPEGRQIVLKDFHIKTVTAMRATTRPSCILLPFQHGKSYLGSMVVPLMDWAEWNNATECRVYWNEDLQLKWIQHLMMEIEYNDSLHRIFPWIRKPQKGDRVYGVWSTEGFAIGGKTAPGRSFEPLTAKQFSYGNRYARVGADDWVNIDNARSIPMQSKLYDYLKTGVMTYLQELRRGSKYRTAWPSFYLCGTLFDQNDLNYRVFEEFKENGYKAIRYDIYVHGDPNRTLWPEFMNADRVAQLKRTLGPRNFNMRCRNLVQGNETSVFPKASVNAACDNDFRWCVVPRNTKIMIGFDPGSGKTTKDSANPAFMVYGLRDANPGNVSVHSLRDRSILMPAESYHHLIQWARLEGYSFTRQCDKVIELARYYGCPVAVEDNNTQTSYADYIRTRAADVQVICHTTGENKRDPDQGVETFEPLFANGRVMIHAEGAPPSDLRALKEELAGWGGKGLKDIVMAMWIAKYQFELRQTYSAPPKVTSYAPPYMARFIGGARR